MLLTKELIMTVNTDQLDEWTALQVMGWDPVVNHDIDAIMHYISHNGEKIRSYEWSPALDYNDAFKLVSKLHSTKWILYSLCHTIDEKFKCTFLHLESGASRESIDESATIAISRAALMTTISQNDL